MIFITGRNERASEYHFDKAYEIESELEAAGKAELLDFVRNVIPKNITCIYIRQSAPLGLGHAVLCARPVIGNEPFAVLLADHARVVQHEVDRLLGILYPMRVPRPGSGRQRIRRLILALAAACPLAHACDPDLKVDQERVKEFWIDSGFATYHFDGDRTSTAAIGIGARSTLPQRFGGDVGTLL